MPILRLGCYKNETFALIITPRRAACCLCRARGYIIATPILSFVTPHKKMLSRHEPTHHTRGSMRVMRNRRYLRRWRVAATRYARSVTAVCGDIIAGYYDASVAAVTLIARY